MKIQPLKPPEGQLKEIVDAANQMDQPIEVAKTEPSRLNSFQRLLITLSGVTEQVRAEATFWVVRPLLSLILLVGCQQWEWGLCMWREAQRLELDPLQTIWG
jgi:hypothetical protein